jgi:outer membrane protein TolC
MKTYPAFLGKIIFLIVGIFSPLYSSPELENYLNQALEQNPKLKVAESQYHASMQKIKQASSLPDPMVSVTHFVESVQTRTGPQENVLMISQKVPFWGKLKNEEDAADYEAQVSWYHFLNQKRLLVRNLSVTYYEYLYLGKAIQLSRENIDLLNKLTPIVESKVASGADLNSLLRLKVEIGKVEDRLQSLENKRIVQSANLQEMLGSTKDELLPFPEWEPSLPVQEFSFASYSTITDHNPELKVFESKRMMAESKRKLAKLNYYPDFTFGLNYIQTGQPEVNPGTPDAGKDPWSISVAVNLPIWSSRNGAKVEEWTAQIESIDQQYEELRNRIKTELSSSLAFHSDANRRLKLYGEELLGLATQAVQNTRTSYENGRVGILEVIDSERTLLDLQLLYWRAASDAIQQRIMIQTMTFSGTK